VNPRAGAKKSHARVRRVRMKMESKAVNHLFREKWQRQAAAGSVWQWHRSVSGLGRKRRVMVAAMPVDSRLDVQTNVEGAVRTAEVKSKVMKNAVPISPSAGPSHFCFPWPVKCAPEAFTTSPGCFLLFRSGGLVVRGLWSRSPVFRFLLSAVPLNQFPGRARKRGAKSCQKVPRNSTLCYLPSARFQLSAFCCSHQPPKISIWVYRSVRRCILVYCIGPKPAKNATPQSSNGQVFGAARTFPIRPDFASVGGTSASCGFATWRLCVEPVSRLAPKPVPKRDIGSGRALLPETTGTRWPIRQLLPPPPGESFS
jgi:hypothetical protein